MQTVHYTGDLLPLIEWVQGRAMCSDESCQSGRPACRGNCKEGPPEEFVSWAKEQQPEGQDQMRFWRSRIVPMPVSDGWPVDRHTHSATMGWPREVITMVLYLQSPKWGGEIGLGGYNRTDPYDFVKPEPGLAVFMDSDRWHCP